ncbi:MAG: hypothetical protein SNJ77_08150 [Cytophagales bacterium]
MNQKFLLIIEISFSFEDFQIKEKEVNLFDKQRNVYVKLTKDEMFGSWKNPNSWEKYYKGMWK